MGKSLWGGNDPDPEETPLENQLRVMEPAAKADPLQGMILGMIAKNPAIAEAFTGIQSIMQQYLDTVTVIKGQNEQILSQLLAMNRTMLEGAPPTPNGEARGVIADGVRCPWCGSVGECHPDCASHGDAAGTGDGPGSDASGSPGSGGGGNLNSSGDPVKAASGTGA